jgi:hypothetical protein
MSARKVKMGGNYEHLYKIDMFANPPMAPISCPPGIEGGVVVTSTFAQCHYLTDKCVLCNHMFKEGEKLLELYCNNEHIFHQDCFEKWYKKHKDCAFCRMVINYKKAEVAEEGEFKPIKPMTDSPLKKVYFENMNSESIHSEHLSAEV